MSTRAVLTARGRLEQGRARPCASTVARAAVGPRRCAVDLQARPAAPAGYDDAAQREDRQQGKGVGEEHRQPSQSAEAASSGAELVVASRRTPAFARPARLVVPSLSGSPATRRSLS